MAPWGHPVYPWSEARSGLLWAPMLLALAPCLLLLTTRPRGAAEGTLAHTVALQARPS